MRPLDFDDNIVVDVINPGLSARLIDPGNGGATRDMPARNVKHRPYIQHGIIGTGLAVNVTRKHCFSLVRYCGLR
jgi:hypothetical protein